MSNATFSQTAFPSLQRDEFAAAEARASTRGHAQGYAAGLHDAEAETAQLRRELEAQHERALEDLAERSRHDALVMSHAIESLRSCALPVLEEAQRTLAEAALVLAEAVVGHELASGDAAARSVLARIHDRVELELVTQLRVHPDMVHRLAALGELPEGVEIVADASLAASDAIALVPDGWLDARIGAALGRARAELLGGVS